MSVSGKVGCGLPSVILHEGEAHIVTVELKNGNVYRGYLETSEDNWNMLLTKAELTKTDGKKMNVNAVYLRGNQVRFVILPDMLQNAPMFKRVKEFKKGITQPQGIGRGKAAAILVKGMFGSHTSLLL